MLNLMNKIMRYYKEINGKRVFFNGILNTGNKQIINPTEMQILADGWQEFVVPETVPYIPSYEELVEQLIREKYSINQELAIQRQRDIKPSEFDDYFAYCEECKLKAKQE